MSTRLAVLFAMLVAAGGVTAQAADAEVTCGGKEATYVGTAGDDHLTRGDFDLGEDPVVALRGGDDRLVLRGDEATGRVTICGAGGRDLLVATKGADPDSYVIDGGSGDDRIGDNSDVDNSDVGPLVLTGGAGDDEMFGADFDDRLNGGSGDDLMLALDGDDRIVGGSGDDSLFGHGGEDRSFGGDGDDRIESGGGDDLADGGDGADSCKSVENARDCES